MAIDEINKTTGLDWFNKAKIEMLGTKCRRTLLVERSLIISISIHKTK